MMNYSRFLNDVSKARKQSLLRSMQHLQILPGMIAMANGLPNPSLFPITGIKVNLSDGSEISLEGQLVKRALQYSESGGLSELIQWLRNLQQEVHHPPTLNHPNIEQALDVLITPGCQDGMAKTMEALLQKEDNLLIESPAFEGALSVARPLGANLIPVESDRYGLRPDKLREALSPWKPSDATDPNSDIPKVLYVVPTAGNPTGYSIPLGRKKEIYAIAREYDLLILEDDPYYYLQFQKSLVPSFLSLDEDGRVVRFDSFAKLLSGGFRVGYMTGPKCITQRVLLHIEVSVLHASTLSQVIILKILENMRLEGFLGHARNLANFYQKQSEACVAALKRHLSGLAEWSSPDGGMFLWLRLKDIEDTYELMTAKAVAKKILFHPGRIFQVDNTSPCPYVRVCFSAATPDEMNLAFQRLAALLREES